MSISMDETDLKILALIQPNSFLTNNELAKKVKLAPSAVLERIKKLEQKGIIEGYPTRIKPDALELKLLAFIFIYDTFFENAFLAKNTPRTFRG